jgi:hypothetical protein
MLYHSLRGSQKKKFGPQGEKETFRFWFFCHLSLRSHTLNSPITFAYAISFMPAVASTSGRLHSEFVLLLSLQTHRETDRFVVVSGVQLPQHDRDTTTTQHPPQSSNQNESESFPRR